MTKKNKINVLIDGRNFTIVGNGSENYVYKIASYVDEKIRETKEKNGKLSGSMAATLAAINITDELYRTDLELRALKDESKGPMGEYALLSEQLKEANAKIKELSLNCNSYKDELLEARRENEQLSKTIVKYEQALELREKDLEQNQSMIKRLQDKIYNNQIELIEIKKELEETLKLYDREKNIFKREEV